MTMTKEMKIGAEAIIARKQNLREEAFMYGEILNLIGIGETVTPTNLCSRYGKKKEDFLNAGNTLTNWLLLGNRYGITPAYAGRWAKAMEKVGYIKREKKPVEPYTIKVASFGWSEELNCWADINKEITINTQMYYTRVK